MRKIIHFNTQEERIAYLKGGFEEIIPQKAEKSAVNEKKSRKTAKKTDETAVSAEKDSSKQTKSKKKKKGAKDEVQAE